MAAETLALGMIALGVLSREGGEGVHAGGAGFAIGERRGAAARLGRPCSAAGETCRAFERRSAQVTGIAQRMEQTHALRGQGGERTDPSTSLVRRTHGRL